MSDELANGSGSIGAVRAAASTAGEIIKIARENPDSSKAGQTAAKSLSVLSTSLYNMLIPLRVLNYAAAKVEDYFATKFGEELGSKLADVPAGQIVEPSTYIAGPVIQGVADTVDEPGLRDMYINLLAKAMNSEARDDTHPSFAEIIKQLSPDEAALLRGVPFDRDSAVAELRLQVETSEGFQVLDRHIASFFTWNVDYEPTHAKAAARIVDNWLRLGLANITYEFFHAAEGSYDWVRTRPEYVYRSERLKEFETVHVEKGLFRPTEFGRAFVEAAGVSAAATSEESPIA